MTFIDAEERAGPRPSVKLTAGEVERFHVWAYAKGSDVVEWTIDLPIIVNGERQHLPINGPTDLSFKTAGQAVDIPDLLRYDGAWTDRTHPWSKLRWTRD